MREGLENPPPIRPLDWIKQEVNEGLHLGLRVCTLSR